MTTDSATGTRVPLVPVLIAGAAAQFADDAFYLVFPPAALLAPLSAFVAVVLTAVAARIVTRHIDGVAVARSGLAVGAVAAGIGLLVGGFGWWGGLLATLTLIAGVVGAVARRPVVTG